MEEEIMALKRSFLHRFTTGLVAACLALAAATAALVPLAVPNPVSAVGCGWLLTLSPPADVNPVNTSHTVTATLVDLVSDEEIPGCVPADPVAPVEGEHVNFEVARDLVEVESGECTTDADGQCDFTYDGPSSPAVDVITAFLDQISEALPATAGKTWVLSEASDRDDCRDGGWQTTVREDGSGFKNQGDCMRYVNTGK
jgi:hypothetical protein